MSDVMQYKTVFAEAHAELEEKKSRFIGHACPVTCEAEALAFLARMRGQYPDARHNVYAYVLRENSTARYSDDHEPQGTAGLPVLDTLRKADITDTAVVVTRYFGGILLGTGGLVRAYTQAAQMALAAARVVTRARLALLQLVVSYSDYQRIPPLLESQGVRVDGSDFGGSVTLSLAILAEQADALIHTLTEATGGRAVCRKVGERFDFL